MSMQRCHGSGLSAEEDVSLNNDSFTYACENCVFFLASKFDLSTPRQSNHFHREIIFLFPDHFHILLTLSNNFVFSTQFRCPNSFHIYVFDLTTRNIAAISNCRFSDIRIFSQSQPKAKSFINRF